MKKIIVYGSGGFGREVHQLIDVTNNRKKTWNFIGYIDDSKAPGVIINNKKVLGNLDFLNQINEEVNLVLAIARPNLIFEIMGKIVNKKIKYPNLIHPDVHFDQKYNKIGRGNIITNGCLFTRNIELGDFNLFNTRVCIGHDNIIGSYNVFQPNTQISGNIVIGNRNFFGVNSLILSKKKIGNDNNIGACSMLIKNIKDNGSYFGVPAMKQFF
jgi:sugar O-acyltransferase (sialic acid O-acetyltransferase NeuD family)